MAENRLSNSIKNVAFAWVGQACSVILSFVTRGVFAYLLAKDYVGLESLFSNVITMLCVADLGIGSAIIFALYEPIAKNDIEKIKSLMRLFKWVYITIGIVISAVGCAIAPFITVLIQDAPNIPNLGGYFVCFVFNAAISYFFSYKGSLIYAHQKSYIVSFIQYGFQILMLLVQIAVLFVTGSYWAYLVVMLGSTLLQNVSQAIVANRMFPYLKEKSVNKLDAETFDGIKKNTFALILHKISGAMSVSIGSIFVSAFAGLAAVASYGSYMIILNSVSRIVDKAFDSVIASIGNMGVTESGERQYKVFKAGFMLATVLYVVICTILLCSLDSFMGIWLGSSYIFPWLTTCLLCIWLFVKGVRSAEQAFTSAYGLYWHTRYKALAEAIALPIFTYAGVKYAGVDGVLVAGILVMLFVSTLLEVRGLYLHGFEKKRMTDYWLGMLKSSFVFAASCLVACVLRTAFPATGVFALVLNVLLGTVVSISICYLAYFRSEEFKYVLSLLKGLFARKQMKK